MAKTIYDISWAEILPEAVKSDSNAKALADAVTPELQAISAAIQECIILARLDYLPENAVDLLAWQYHVDFYESGADIEVKRKLVRQSIDWHRHKGTPYAVQSIVSAILEGAEVQEWFEYGGEPYHFRVHLISGPMTEAATLEKLVKAINSVKNTRSWLDGVSFVRNTVQTVYLAGVFHRHKNLVINLPQFKMPDIADIKYFGSANNIHKEVIIWQTGMD